MKKPGPDALAGSLLLLLLLLSLNGLTNARSARDGSGPPAVERVFVQISGDIPSPGVYGFSSPPSLERLIARAGGRSAPGDTDGAEGKRILESGSWIERKKGPNGAGTHQGTMSAFHRIALGIPLPVNCETRDGLTAIPGVGPKTAGAIVRHRERSGAFQDFDQLPAVHGIGPSTIGKIRPYVTFFACREGAPAPPFMDTEGP